MQARAVALKTRPEGMPTADNFQIMSIDVPEPQDGEIQVKNVLCIGRPMRVICANLMYRPFKLARH